MGREEDAVNVYELSADAVGRMIPVDLATLEDEPPSPIGHFDFHGCICGVASFVGQPPWELHNGGDELLHILAGECDLTVLTNGEEESRRLRQGDVAIVPQGCWHRNHAATGVTMLFMTPREGGDHSWEDPRRQGR
jgi:mannose-6-phosphate isomerase-like protein (cupin superfamily)